MQIKREEEQNQPHLHRGVDGGMKSLVNFLKTFSFLYTLLKTDQNEQTFWVAERVSGLENANSVPLCNESDIGMIPALGAGGPGFDSRLTPSNFFFFLVMKVMNLIRRNEYSIPPPQ